MSLIEIDVDRQVGARIHQLRAERGLTLESLARQAAVSRAMLSRVERGESSPTAQLLVKICGGLGVTPSLLFAKAETGASPVSRRPDQPTWRDPASGYLRRNVSPADTGSSVDLVEVEFPPDASVTLDSPQLTGWSQHVWVLDGTLDLALGEEAYRLDRGDCLWMRFDRPITFRNVTTRLVRYAVLLSQGAKQS